MTADDLEVLEHRVPPAADHAAGTGPALAVFAREVRRRGGGGLPALLFLQGGPGIASPRPPFAAWVERLAAHFRLLLLDQRGTGLSGPLDHRSLTAGGRPLPRPGALADLCAHFRADGIVADAERLRRHLGLDRWTTLGQSFGGFVTLTYLSRAPEALRACLITGGLTSPTAAAEEVYPLTLAATTRAERAYFARYPQDRDRLDRLLSLAAADPPVLESGRRLTPRLLRLLGGQLGARTGWTTLHTLLADAVAGDRPHITGAAIARIDALLSYRTAPLYAVVHEAIYPGAGTHGGWAAERALHASASPPQLLGEVVQRFLFDARAPDADPALVPFGPAADLIAGRTDWPPLYDLDRLRENRVPVLATAYRDDMFVPIEHSRRAAAGEVGGVELVVREDKLHDGLRDGTDVVDDLLRRLDRATRRPVGGAPSSPAHP